MNVVVGTPPVEVGIIRHRNNKRCANIKSRDGLTDKLAECEMFAYVIGKCYLYSQFAKRLTLKAYAQENNDRHPPCIAQPSC